MLEVVVSSQKIASFWLEPTTSNIKLNMTSHSYKKLINSNLVRALTKILASLLAWTFQPEVRILGTVLVLDVSH